MSSRATASAAPFAVRPFARDDTSGVLTLMRKLAQFEGYIDQFTVTERDLVERGICPNPQFGVLLAYRVSDPSVVVGIAVYYLVPFTYDLYPDLILKELYVDDAHRGLGVARQLMQQLTNTAAVAGCKRMRWLVLRDNKGARAFYASLGAAHDQQWQNWVLKIAP